MSASEVFVMMEFLEIQSHVRSEIVKAKGGDAKSLASLRALVAGMKRDEQLGHVCEEGATCPAHRLIAEVEKAIAEIDTQSKGQHEREAAEQKRRVDAEIQAEQAKRHAESKGNPGASYAKEIQDEDKRAGVSQAGKPEGSPCPHNDNPFDPKNFFDITGSVYQILFARKIQPCEEPCPRSQASKNVGHGVRSVNVPGFQPLVVWRKPAIAGDARGSVTPMPPLGWDRDILIPCACGTHESKATHLVLAIDTTPESDQYTWEYRSARYTAKDAQYHQYMQARTRAAEILDWINAVVAVRSGSARSFPVWETRWVG